MSENFYEQNHYNPQGVEEVKKGCRVSFYLIVILLVASIVSIVLGL